MMRAHHYIGERGEEDDADNDEKSTSISPKMHLLNAWEGRGMVSSFDKLAQVWRPPIG